MDDTTTISKAANSPNTTIELLDYALVDQLLELDSTGEFQKEALHVFINQTGKLIQELFECLRQADAMGVRKTLQTIEADSSTLGATGIVDAVLMIRQVMKSSDYDVEPMLELLNTSYKDTCTLFYEKYLSSK